MIAFATERQPADAAADCWCSSEPAARSRSARAVASRVRLLVCAADQSKRHACCEMLGRQATASGTLSESSHSSAVGPTTHQHCWSSSCAAPLLARSGSDAGRSGRFPVLHPSRRLGRRVGRPPGAVTAVLFLLDECANVAPLSDLPGMLSEAGRPRSLRSSASFRL